MLTFKRRTIKKINNNGDIYADQTLKNKHPKNCYNLRNVFSDGIRLLINGERSVGKKS